MKKHFTIAAITLALLLVVGCQHNPGTTNPQLKAAQNNDQVSIVLNLFCKQEINFKNTIDAATHKSVQQKCLQIAQYDEKVTSDIAANDLTTAQKDIGLAVSLAQSISADLLNIKDAGTKSTLQIAQESLVIGLTTWQTALAQLGK